MKKRFFFFISLLFIFLCLTNYTKLNAKNFEDKVMYEKYAKIISANYVNSELIIQLEIDEETYSGKFIKDVSYEDYLFLHHNEGLIINVTFYKLNNQLMILKWFA